MVNVFEKSITQATHNLMRARGESGREFSSEPRKLFEPISDAISKNGIMRKTTLKVEYNFFQLRLASYSGEYPVWLIAVNSTHNFMEDPTNV